MSALPEQITSTKFEVTSSNNPKLIVTRILYFFFFAAFGIIITYLNIYYRAIGLTGVQIGIINSVAPIIGIIASPLWGFISDRYGLVRTLLIIGGLGTILSVSGLSIVQTFVWLLPLTIAYAFFSNPILPLLDSTTLQLLGDKPEGYGRERVWGSLGFIISTWSFGYILQRVGLHWLFPSYISMMLAMLLAVNWLPSGRASLNQSLFGGISQLVVEQRWLLFSASILVLGVGNSALQEFGGIYLKEMGAKEGLIGGVAAVGTVSELPILFWGATLLLRWGPWRLLLLAYLIAVVRWLLFSIIPSPEWAIPISLLHSITFGVYWIAGIAYVDSIAPADMKATAQGLFYAAFGLSRTVASPINGYIFDTFGAANLFRCGAVLGLAAAFLLWIGRPATLADSRSINVC